MGGNVGIWGSLFGAEQQRRIEPRIVASTPLDRPNLSAEELLAFLNNDSGVVGAFGPRVTEQSAMRTSTVFRCVEVLAGVVASAPLSVYLDSETGGRAIAPTHKLHQVLHISPAPDRALTSAAWRKMAMYHLLLWGNAYTLIRRDLSSRVTYLEPVLPWQVDVSVTDTGRKAYRVHRDGGAVEYHDHSDVLHFMGPSFDGVTGVSRIQTFARTAVALAQVFEEQIGRVHENAARPSGMVTSPPGVTVDGVKRMRATWSSAYSGRENAGRVVFADAETKYTPFQMSPEDLNTIEARRFQSLEICRAFGVPPHLVFEAAGTSAWGSGIEQLTLGFRQQTVNPLLCDLEAEIRMKLFLRDRHYAAFDRTALIEMDAKAAAEVAQIEIQSGVRTINERRNTLLLPDVPDGDKTRANVTLAPLDYAMQQNATKGTPNEPPKPSK